MSAHAHLRVVDSRTGEIQAGCPECEFKDERIKQLKRDCASWMRRAQKAEADRELERQADPQRREILSVIERWKAATGHPRANTNAGDRFDLIKARLKEGYTIDQLLLAVEGIGAFRYVVNGQRVREGKRSHRHDRLGIALGSGEALEKFANLGWQAKR